jgi:hypothetical protein
VFGLRNKRDWFATKYLLLQGLEGDPNSPALIGLRSILAGFLKLIYLIVTRQYLVCTDFITTMLLGWAVLSILFVYLYREHESYPGAALVTSIFIPLFLLPSQLDALRGDPQLINHRHMIAGLALDLGINDHEIIQTIYPYYEIYIIAKEAVRSHLSIFGVSTFRNARRCLQQDATTIPLHECQGYIEAINPVKDVNGVPRASGWAYDRNASQVPQEVFMVDTQNKVVGLALTEIPRMDVESALSRKAN